MSSLYLVIALAVVSITCIVMTVRYATKYSSASERMKILRNQFKSREFYDKEMRKPLRTGRGLIRDLSSRAGLPDKDSGNNS